ncbi:MAG: ATP-binding SpoIIE family protein phosphatase [Thiobacillaceae bacterium]
MTVAAALKILVADDVTADVAVVRAVAGRLGHSVVTAKDGREAVRRYQEEAPDLVFMDIMLPEMDALAAVRAIRSLPAGRSVPVLFLSTPDRMEDAIEGLQCGGDDYLVKPVDLRLLQAKINAHAKTIALQREVLRHAEELQVWRQAAEDEARLGRHIMERLTDTAGLRDPMLRTYNRPAGDFSGDLLCATRGPGDILYLLLADATGHGLPAALSAMPLPQVFHGMAAKGFSLASMAGELNRKLKRLMPADRFVAATLAAIDVKSGTVEIWNGGNPDALLIGERGEVIQRWRSRHPPLGILPEDSFSGETETYRVQAPGDLLICSDGLLEAQSPDGKGYGLDRIVDELARAPRRDRHARLLDGLAAHLAGGVPHDDVSFMLVDIPLERRQSLRSVSTEAGRRTVSDWRFELSYGAAELRYLDVVPTVLSILTQIEALQPHKGALFLVVSELYNNALDHGLLALDSAVKAEEDGFERYLGQRAERLQALSEGRIELAFHMHMDGGEAVLDIRVRDSGPGFGYVDFVSPHMDDDRAYHGRGIALVRSLCRELVYSGCGNEVLARYAL